MDPDCEGEGCVNVWEECEAKCKYCPACDAAFGAWVDDEANVGVGHADFKESY